MQGILITALGGVIVSGLASYVAFGQGKKNERLAWETANVETLVGANTNLSEEIDRLEGEIFDAQNIDIEAGGTITKVETRIIEKIKEVPVEKVVKVYGDCRVDYGIIGLRNSWAKGNSLDEEARETKTGYLPLVGAEEMP